MSGLPWARIEGMALAVVVRRTLREHAQLDRRYAVACAERVDERLARTLHCRDAVAREPSRFRATIAPACTLGGSGKVAIASLFQLMRCRATVRRNMRMA